MKGLTRRDAIRLAGLGSCAAALVAARPLIAAESAGAAAAAVSPSAGAAATGKAGAVPPVAGPNAKAAEAMMREGRNCAQSVLVSCGKPYGLSEEMGCRMGSAFIGGIGMMGLTCGAVAGALMVIGLKHAQLDLKDAQSASDAIGAARELARRFTELHGSIVCRELLGHDINTPEGLKTIKQLGLIKTKCPIYVRDAAALIEELLTDKPTA
jgi:C_GCAxxG_C_C family probable redox protein